MNPQEDGATPQPITTRKPKLRDSQNNSVANSESNLPQLPEQSDSAVDSNTALQAEDSGEEVDINKLIPESASRVVDVITSLAKQLTESIEAANLDDKEKIPFLANLQRLINVQHRIEKDIIDEESGGPVANPLKAELVQAWKIIEAERERDLKQQDEISELTNKLKNPRAVTPPPVNAEHPAIEKKTDVTYQIMQMENLRVLSLVNIFNFNFVSNCLEK